ncbi:hypothetical protein GBZ26_07780 [Azospirillum formosense]|uniref:Uncharacterized protein n=1 Tax=Azospirillum formosense TaxID=861533 RepID=A0ABX2L1P3_9PROT|nr:helix-turn-helix domain-containing protein [Azospirillum formosense]NUB19110.1 hypothetical protein [Azospirillum formosense]
MNVAAEHPLARAIAIVGSQRALAKLIGTTQQNISRMMRMRTVSAKFAPRIERATGGQVLRHELCPDVEWEADSRNGNRTDAIREMA